MRSNALPLALLAGAALAACGGDDAADPTVPVATPAATVAAGSAPVTAATVPASVATPVEPTTTATPETMISVADERIAITLALPDEHPVINAGEHDFNNGPECMTPYWQLDGGVDLEAWPASCDPHNSNPGNGDYGHYRSAADAPAPIDPVEVETVLGPAEVFGQLYYQCTNECVEWDLDVAVITLSEPVNAEYPTLTVIAAAEDLTRDDLLALIDSFAAG